MTNTSVMDAPAGRVARHSSGARIPGLDVARGIAIAGTLWTNIWLFTHPHGLVGMLSQPVTPETGDAAAVAQLAIMALSQGKFLALLSLMFGMGLAIQHASAQRRGVRWPGGYLWRAFLLFIDGVINYVLIAEFDVLMGYAVTGAIVAWLLLTRPAAQRTMIAVFGGLHVLVISGIAALVWAFPGEGGGAPLATPYADGSFADLVAFRLDNGAMFRAEPALIGLLSVAMFLLGAHLLRAGVFDPDAAGAALRRRLVAIGAVALPVDLALGVWGGAGGMLLERYVVAPLVALGLLGLIAGWSTRGLEVTWAGRRLREVGRTALSCYLLQNLMAGALFYGWGLGLADELGAWRVPATLPAYAVVVGVVVAFAHLWLRRFDRGPVEWLWKQGARLVPERPRVGVPGR